MILSNTRPLVAPSQSPATADHARHWREAQQRKRAWTLLFCLGLAAATAGSAWVADANFPKLVANIGNFFSYFDRILTLDSGPAAGQRVWSAPGEWLWGLGKWLPLLGDTLLMAYLGTLMGAVGALALCFSPARNLTPNPWLRIGVKRLLEFCRTVPEIVFALIFVVAFGLGPMAGVMAIAVHTLGALGKQFSEVVENIDMKPVDGLISTGASHWPTIRFAVIPQIMSNLVSYTLMRFEVNVRSASVMGFVGAGGIGQDLIEAIRKFYYADVSALLLLIIICVCLIDFGSEKLRHALLGREGRP